MTARISIFFAQADNAIERYWHSEEVDTRVFLTPEKIQQKIKTSAITDAFTVSGFMLLLLHGVLETSPSTLDMNS